MISHLFASSPGDMTARYPLMRDLWTAFCAAVLTASTQHLLGAWTGPWAVMLVFFSTAAYYVFIHWEAYTAFMRRLFAGLLVLVCVGSSVVGPMHGPLVIYVLEHYWHLLILTGWALYSYSRIPGDSRAGTWSLRNTPFAKIVAISWCWTMTTAWVPMILSDHRSGYAFLASRFFFIAAISLAFDTVDKEVDHGRITTLVTRLGVGPARVVAAACLILSDLFFHSSIPSSLYIQPALIALIPLLTIGPGRKEWKHYVLDGMLIVYAICVGFA